MSVFRRGRLVRRSGFGALFIVVVVVVFVGFVRVSVIVVVVLISVVGDTWRWRVFGIYFSVFRRFVFLFVVVVSGVFVVFVFRFEAVFVVVSVFVV